ncbi:MAG: DUF2851 family protein [Bacteroidales bacterium]|nr:DUF2851 family protein [Bacteroidales bacterium]
MTEAFLQYVWQHQLAGKQLMTTDGRKVSIVRAGDLNRDAGPDFFNARIIIDDIEWVGNVEVHIHTSDWNAHRHSLDKAYNSIVLHVVYEHDKEIILENGKSPATVELKQFLEPSLLERYDTLMHNVAEDEVACKDSIPDVPEFVLDSSLDRLLVERIEAKTDVVRRMLEESRGGWEQTCYWLIARYFGGRVNALPFELLAKSVDQRLLARWKDNPQRMEAVLMGQSGLLEGHFNDDYPRLLQNDYAAIRHGASLIPLEGHLWKFYCLRPSSFPTIRISQFSHLLAESSNLFSTLLETGDAKKMVSIFNKSAGDYWTSHYRFDQETSKKSPKRIGVAQSVSLIINAWVPLLFEYGRQHGQQHYKDQAIDLLHQLPAENNNITRRWKSLGVDFSDAGRTQALLQLYNSYCSKRRCLDCAVGYHIIKRK